MLLHRERVLEACGRLCCLSAGKSYICVSELVAYVVDIATIVVVLEGVISPSPKQ